MRQNLTLLFVLYSLCGAAQLYVQQGTTLNLGSSDAILSSQEQFHQIHAPIKGTGTLLLNSLGPQLLDSNQEVWEIPNLILQNAALVHINTPLRFLQHFTIQLGELHLEQPLFFPNPQALRLLGNSSIQNIEFLVYDLQIERSQPFLVWNHYPTLKYTTPTFMALENRCHFLIKNRSIFGALFSSNAIAHIQRITPPPQTV